MNVNNINVLNVNNMNVAVNNCMELRMCGFMNVWNDCVDLMYLMEYVVGRKKMLMSVGLSLQKDLLYDYKYPGTVL